MPVRIHVCRRLVCILLGRHRFRRPHHILLEPPQHRLHRRAHRSRHRLALRRSRRRCLPGRSLSRRLRRPNPRQHHDYHHPHPSPTLHRRLHFRILPAPRAYSPAQFATTPSHVATAACPARLLLAYGQGEEARFLECGGPTPLFFQPTNPNHARIFPVQTTVPRPNPPCPFVQRDQLGEYFRTAPCTPPNRMAYYHQGAVHEKTHLASRSRRHHSHFRHNQPLT